MIHKIRQQFIIIATLSLVGTLTVLLGIINIFNYYQTTERTDRLIALLNENNGRFPDFSTPAMLPPNSRFQMTEETPFETRFFVADATRDKVVTHINTDNTVLDMDSAYSLALKILHKNKSTGYMDNYRYGVFETTSGYRIVVIDNSQQRQTLKSFLTITIIAGLICVIIVFLLLLFLSKKITRPFILNMEKQKQFITDASHELKTPLTIISANSYILDMTYGENEWLDSIKNQTERMNRLVNSLIELAKTEEPSETGNELMERFNLSETVQTIAASFEPVLASDHKELQTRITPDLYVKGYTDSIYRLIMILIDNAVKYSSPGGWVYISLYKEGREIILNVVNPVDEVDPSEITRFFDRFYRADRSRSTDLVGYGIGLSVAHAIVQRHKGKIKVGSRSNKEIKFTVSLPA